MKKQEIANILEDWWNDEKTCCGEKDICTTEKCDLCVDCFERLANKFGLKTTSYHFKTEVVVK